MADRIVRAYPGGLDTSLAIGGIADQAGAEVIAVVLWGLPSEVAATRDLRAGRSVG